MSERNYGGYTIKRETRRILGNKRNCLYVVRLDGVEVCNFETLKAAKSWIDANPV